MAREQPPLGSFRGQEGSRWINQRPTGEEIAKWFGENVPLHDGMDPSKYVGGMTLIPSNERTTEIVVQGDSIIERKVRNIVFTPYCKVDTRIKYFWDLVLHHDEWVGAIEPVDVARPEGAQPLAPGFYSFTVPVDGQHVQFVACAMRVRVYDRSTVQYIDVPDGMGKKRRIMEGVPVIDAPPATKMIPLLQRSWNSTIEADQYSLMKAETGAAGRALGMAGMLVAPGAGIATAEDMQEMSGQPAPATDGGDLGEVPAAGAAEGDQASADEQLRGRALELRSILEQQSEAAFNEFSEWAKSRKLNLDEAEGPVLRGAVRKLEKALEAVPAEPTVAEG